ncbi:Holliday junction branch migration protein RuvA [Microbacterium amylolyticum]|uniref:Holliday junction branch migration complex subunit RuvA n=1 Tax=Microbacterium amylolyticum TaxID=936337 RepID=A0ABS4ZE06_9MICO|nr:Holliday junction branch migration protein RuvA [Microbacterium amylolyticum]MBP2435516.1 Holliday junction DNA helicase RuvA [Microbacterium amylolyticum]
MISSLRGSVLHAGLDQVVLEVGGVGFSVAVPPDVARTARNGEELFLFTHLVVREDALSLFGFSSRDELDVFGILLGVSGIGPKSALGVLSSLTIDQIAEAVEAEDEKPFKKVSGIGPKTAKLIALQLQGKLAPAAGRTVRAGAAAPDVVSQVVQAVTGLGWQEKVAAEAVGLAAEQASEIDRANVQALLRLTLAALGAGGGARV